MVKCGMSMSLNVDKNNR